MNIPPLDALKKIANASIINLNSEAAKKIKKTFVGAGRYSHGLHLEDFAFLIAKYFSDIENRRTREGQPTTLSDIQSLIVQQLIGIPAKKVNRNLNNDIVAQKIESYCNSAQENWRFTFTVHSSPSGGTLKYSVMDVKLIGGNKLGLGGLFDL